MARPKKNKFDDLPDDFKDAVEQSSTSEIRSRLSEVVLLEMAEKEFMDNDPAVAEAREALDNVLSPYKENLKIYKLKKLYCKRVLDDKGGA